MSSEDYPRANHRHHYFIDGAEAFAAAAHGPWREIRTAPVLQRVIVGASRLTENGVGSYWWQENDVISADRLPTRHPAAMHWRACQR
ncbi:hypothetical protein ACWIGM_03360 [Bosea sp. NPDC055332]